jgi:hypothetical protein
MGSWRNSGYRRLAPAALQGAGRGRFDQPATQCLPCLELVRIRHGVGRATGRKAHEFHLAGRAQQCAHAEPRSRATVERNSHEMRQRFNQRHQVIAGMVADPAIEASFALRLGDDVPKADAMTQQRLQTREVVETVNLLADHVTDQMPEAVGVLVNLTLMRLPPRLQLPP